MESTLVQLFAAILVLHRSAAEPPSCSLVVNPDNLVVKYGDPASANCSSDKVEELMGWETPAGNVGKENVQHVEWSVESLTNWNVDVIMCYYTGLEHQCNISLSIIIYKTPDSVSLELKKHTGPLKEKEEFQLECKVESVAPVQFLTIEWLRGAKLLKTSSYSDFHVEGKENENATVRDTQNFTTSKEDDGVQYRCVAKLDLDPLQPIPEVQSESMTMDVYYAPRSSNPASNVTVVQGASMELPCAADSNPQPERRWTHNGRNLSETNSVLKVASVQFADQGDYECIVSNPVGLAVIRRTVQVVVDYKTIICAVVSAVALLIAIFAIVKCCKHHKENKTGFYDLIAVTRKIKCVA
ncbi:cell adhesion molecule 4-like [Denticeps clupeoides]|uniref:cell adhesion molecule 4-like n=1 Tax=Denticeps clupeoides TaxID=299321 RepID=UPI0010A3C2EB|nr:cell adhesion molecule 4-like [Denticeps clupeoides]